MFLGRQDLDDKAPGGLLVDRTLVCLSRRRAAIGSLKTEHWLVEKMGMKIESERHTENCSVIFCMLAESGLWAIGDTRSSLGPMCWREMIGERQASVCRGSLRYVFCLSQCSQCSRQDWLILGLGLVECEYGRSGIGEGEMFIKYTPKLPTSSRLVLLVVVVNVHAVSVSLSLSLAVTTAKALLRTKEGGKKK